MRRKEAIHRKKIQAKNRSTIYKYSIISNKNKLPNTRRKNSLQQQIKNPSIS